MSRYDDDEDSGPLLDDIVERNSYSQPAEQFGQGPTVYENEQTYCQVRWLPILVKMKFFFVVMVLKTFLGLMAFLSCHQRLGASICGMGIGLIIFFLALIMLFWNEGVPQSHAFAAHVLHMCLGAIQGTLCKGI